MVTVGMNYEVLPGKEEQFEKVFDGVVELMGTLAGHEDTQLYRGAKQPRKYLIVSQWSDRAAFDAFIASDQFRKVANWGAEKILAGRPTHEVYGGDDSPRSGGCPVH